MELVIEGTAFVGTKCMPCCIGIENGVIAAIERVLTGDTHIVLGEHELILPGAIDPHVHFRDPGMTGKEDFSTGTIAAAFGGVTCVIDMPNTVPQTTTAAALSEKRALVAEKAYVDFGLYAGITGSQSRKDITALARSATAFKLYLAPSTGNLLFDGDLHATFTELAAFDKPIAVHAEDHESLIDRQVTNLREHLMARPNRAEEIAVRRVIDAAKGTNARVHICHLSTREALAALAAQKQRTVMAEAAPHYLYLTQMTPFAQESFGRTNPPLRTAADKEALWQALIHGGCDFIGSDHAPHTLSEKQAAFTEAPSGMPGVETMIPLLLHEVKRGVLPLARFIELTATTPAARFGLNKGSLSVGRDADLMIVNLNAVEDIRGDALHSKCGWSAYEGMRAIFPASCMVRGMFVVRDRELVGDAGHGNYINAE